MKIWILLGIILGIQNGLLAVKIDDVSYIYAHGLAHHKEQAYWYLKQKPNGKVNKHYLIEKNLFTFDFPDATQRFWRVNFPQCSLGQANDIYAFYKAFIETKETLVSRNTSQDLVLIGLSRGASVILSFLALFNASNVKAAVIESPFDSLYNVVKAKLNSFDKVPGLTNIVYSLLGTCFMQHKRHGICPLDIVQHIPQDLPLLFIASKQDTTVPYERTLDLYAKLLKTGHTNAHILILDTGRHSKLLIDEQGDIYQNTVHAFFKKYHLPHNPSFAIQGQETLAKCQPTIQDLEIK